MSRLTDRTKWRNMARPLPDMDIARPLRFTSGASIASQGNTNRAAEGALKHLLHGARSHEPAEIPSPARPTDAGAVLRRESGGSLRRHAHLQGREMTLISKYQLSAVESGPHIWPHLSPAGLDERPVTPAVARAARPPRQNEISLDQEGTAMLNSVAASQDRAALPRAPLAASPEVRIAQVTAVAREASHVRRSLFVQGLPLIVVLIVQSALSLRLVWANTAFTDEALYLRSGHLEIQHWLYGAQIPAFPTYFSGSPVIYPPIGALADSVGGLAAARILSLCFMLGATCFLWATARRLHAGRAAFFAAALFAVLGPTVRLGAFATYDAMSLCLVGLAAWCAVRAGEQRRSSGWLAGAALALALANAAKYVRVFLIL